MVVVLGYRYGWIPDADIIRTAAQRKHLEIDDLERSVTALEIEYGVLCDQAKYANTLFYFREIEGNVPSDYVAEDKQHEEKISALKNRIKDITGGKTRYYTLTWNGDRQAVIDGVLARNNRELPIPVINEMLKLKASDNPRYLSLLVQRLLMMNSDDFMDIKSRGDGMAAIEQRQLEPIQ